MTGELLRLLISDFLHGGIKDNGLTLNGKKAICASNNLKRERKKTTEK